MRLIEAIPKKQIRIHGFDYEVYAPVRYASGVLRSTINGVTRALNVRTYSAVRDPNKRLASFKKELISRLNKINRFVEDHYTGDKLRTSKGTDDVSLFTVGTGELRISYYAYCRVSFKNKRYTVDLGMHHLVTQSQIKKAINKAKKHKEIENQMYNLSLLDKRKKFRDLVQSQVDDRDLELFEQALYNT